MKSLAPKLAAFLVLIVLPFVLRAWPIEHGLPRNYLPDTHIVRSALGMAQDKDLVPPVRKYSSYPYFLPYLLLPAYAAQYAAGKARGAWTDARGFGDHVLEHPEDAQLVARWLVLLFGALTPWAVWRAARAAGLGRGAWISAWLVATGLLHLQFSVHERPWVPLVFFMVLAAWMATLYVNDGRARWLIASGVAAGLSLACHQGGLPAVALPALAWLYGPRKRWRELGYALATFALVALVCGHPYMLRYGWTRWEDSTGGEAAADQSAMNVGGLRLVFGARVESVTRLGRAFFGYDPAVLLLGLAGCWLAWRVRALRPTLIFVVAWAAFFLTQQSDHVRYLLPVAVFLALPAGFLAERWMTQRSSALALGLLLVFPLVQALRFDWLLTRTDTRASGELLLSQIPAGAVVAIDRYGPDVALDEHALERLAGLREKTGEGLRARERHRLELLQAGRTPPDGRGIDALHVEEILDINPRAERPLSLRKQFPELGPSVWEALTQLGATHLVLVTRRPELQPSFLAPVVAGRKPLWTLDPSSSAEHPTQECFLPTEMDFPLQGLWTVNRPGPWMALYPLR